MTVITQPLRLAVGVEITEATALPAAIRGHLDDETQDSYAISRPYARVRSKIISAEAGELVQRFREPTRLVDALLAISGPGEDVAAALDDSLPLIASLLKDRVLLGPDDPEPGSQLATLVPGQQVLGATLEEQIYRVDETSVWRAVQGGANVAVKLEVAADDACPEHLSVEVESLERTAGLSQTPTLVAHGSFSIGYALILGWVDGQHVNRVMVRDQRDDLELALTVIDAYSDLHGCGVLHGDVHPGNILVDNTPERPQVTLIDFGMAQIDGRTSARGGVSDYFDPEFARAQLREQYAVATVLLEALLGRHPIELPVEIADQLQAIVDHDPGAVEGLVLSAAVGAVFAKARASDPADRFVSLDEMAKALRTAARADQAPPSEARSARPDSIIADLGIVDPTRMLMPASAPRATVFYGAAGVALALLRHAETSGDAEALAAARVWAERALAEPSDDGFINTTLTLDPSSVNRQSLFHGEVGPIGVLALVAAAQADNETLDSCVRNILGRTVATIGFDPMMGRPSVLRLLTRLVGTPGVAPELCGQLTERAGAVATAIATEMAEHPAIGECRSTYLGAAHGWSGVLLALLRAASAGVAALDSSVHSRLDQLASLASVNGDGYWWPAYIDEFGEPGAPMDGWCNGSAGFIATFGAASEVLCDGRYLEIAAGAAQSALAQPSGIHNLCCGSAGKALALLDLARITGESEWHRCAVSFVDEGLFIRRSGGPGLRDLADFPLSLFKGDLGLVVAANALINTPTSDDLLS